MATSKPSTIDTPPQSPKTVQVIHEQSSVSALMTLLIERLDAEASSETASGALLLDVDIDGFRYQLIRCTSSRDRPALSPRELEIAKMVAKGYASKTIAAVLDISAWTVSTHLRRVFAKLGVSSRAAMVAALLGNDVFSYPDRSSTGPVVNGAAMDRLRETNPR